MTEQLEEELCSEEYHEHQRKPYMVQLQSSPPRHQLPAPDAGYGQKSELSERQFYFLLLAYGKQAEGGDD